MTDQYFSDRYIPGEGPENARILFVGEAGGETEYEQLRPFVGMSGEKFMECLGRAGLSRSDVRLDNLCHYRPFHNKFEYLLKTEALREGLRELYAWIEKHRPNVVVALGNWPLQFLTGRKGIMKWRGSILPYINDESIKVIPTVHPAAVLRDRGLYPTFDLDIKRIAADAAFPERRLPVRRFIINPRGLELEEWTQRLCDAELLGTDIETVKGSSKILCVGFAPSPDLAVCIVPEHHEGRRAIERILRSNASKVFQFGTFDTIQLIELNNFEFRDPKAEALGRPYFWDTLIAQHIMAPELPRSLEYLTSVYTREPYYKTVGRGTIPPDEKGWSERIERQPLYEYNCRDCCCTIEIALQQMKELEESPINLQRVFSFEMEMLDVANHMANAGMNIDDERRAMIENVLLEKWAKKQFILDRMTGFETNVRSPKLKMILYEKLGLPSRRKREGTITTDEDAIVSLITFCKDKIASYKRPDTIIEWKIKLAVCQTILEIRGIRQVLSNYILKEMRSGKARARPDGRIHSTYKVGGTETGRWSSAKYVDGSGFNAQTLPRDPVEVPDEMLNTKTATEAMRKELAKDEVDEDVVVAEEVVV